jgi:hypothetical protein
MKCEHKNVWIEESYLWRGVLENEEYVASLKENTIEITCIDCGEIVEQGDNEDIADKIKFI